MEDEVRFSLLARIRKTYEVSKCCVICEHGLLLSMEKSFSTSLLLYKNNNNNKQFDSVPEHIKLMTLSLALNKEHLF